MTLDRYSESAPGRTQLYRIIFLLPDVLGLQLRVMCNELGTFSEIAVGEVPSNDITALIYHWRFAVIGVQPPEVYLKQIH